MATTDDLFYTNTLHYVLDRADNLEHHGNGWIATCPAHDQHPDDDDGAPRLFIHDLDDGCVMLECEAGCSLNSMVNAFSMKVTGIRAPEYKCFKWDWPDGR